ncbi:MAG: aconitase X [Hyphomicrobiaceae bacterium]|nr:aconitase X [Hyphomicrobiaceae bacterium]MDX2448929.1 aconitase X [Hyphomicrobiaceae bacterium]
MTKGTPDYARYAERQSDMLGLGPDGKPDPNYDATAIGVTPTLTAYDPSNPPPQMKLTQEEQDILDGKKGKAHAKVMRTLVDHGNLFGATKLVDLGGAPHTSFFTGTPAMSPLIELFTECADEGLKAYAPYTVNPRPHDLYNVETSADEQNMIFEGYPLQLEVDHLHVRLGGRNLDTRSCMCYLPEVGNAPKKGTFVAWAESSAINAGNSILGIRTNRNSCGMDLMCALAGKAPYFGLMTDEGRKAKWLIEVKTSGEPDWGVLGGAIGEKCVEDPPFIVGIDKYFDGKITPQNVHKLKAMGAATASNGAIGLYHVENLTPDALDKGRDLLVKDYQTYVIDDAEIERVRSTYPNLWPENVKKPNRAYIGCPHNTYQEMMNWGTGILDALKARGQEKIALPTHMFSATVVRDHVFMEHPVMMRDLKKAGVTFTNTCVVCFSGLKGYNDTEFGVTNSNKTRKYSNSIYLKDDDLLEVIMTGELPT